MKYKIEKFIKRNWLYILLAAWILIYWMIVREVTETDGDRLITELTVSELFWTVFIAAYVGAGFSK